MDCILHGKVSSSEPKDDEGFQLIVYLARKISIYHGRPTSIARSDIDTDLPTNLKLDARDFFEPSRLLASVQLTTLAESLQQEM